MGLTAFTDADRRIMARVPRARGRKAKLTAEQVIDIRRRMDSLTVPWSIRQLAAEYGVSVQLIMRVARRKRWDEPAFEPDQAPWWWRERFR